MTFYRIIILTYLAITNFSYCGEVEHDTAQAILLESQKHNIDPRILFTLIDIESGFNPNAICVETKSKEAAYSLKKLSSDTIKIHVGKTYHSKWWMVSIYPSTPDEAKVISQTLKQLGFLYDAGLMQINSKNFKKSEAQKIFDPVYNVKKGAKILKGCMKSFKSFVHQVECYNRGAGNLMRSIRKGKSYYPYYKRYRNKWDF